MWISSPLDVSVAQQLEAGISSQCLLPFSDGSISGKGNYKSEECKFVTVAKERQKNYHHCRGWDGLGMELRMVLLCWDVLILLKGF